MAQSLKPHIYDDTIYMSKLFEMIDTQYSNKKFLWSELAKFKDYLQLTGVPLTTFAANVGILRMRSTDSELIDKITFQFASGDFFGTQEEYYNFMKFYFGLNSNQIKIREVPNTKLIITVPDTLDPIEATARVQSLKATGVNLQIANTEYVIDYTYTGLLAFSYTEIKDNMKYKRS